MKKIMEKTGEKINHRLRLWCNRLSNQMRFAVVMTMLMLFGALSVYMAIGAVYFLQRPDLNIKHMETVKFQHSGNDSIQLLKIKEYDFDE